MKSSVAQLFKKVSMGFRENIGTTFERFQILSGMKSSLWFSRYNTSERKGIGSWFGLKKIQETSTLPPKNLLITCDLFPL